MKKQSENITWLTPSQWEKENDMSLCGSSPVYEHRGGSYWFLTQYAAHLYRKGYYEENMHREKLFCVVADPRLGIPPADWRPE